jgi:predicted RNA-binding Zn ribbon-like protein
MPKEPPVHLRLLEDFVNTVELDGDEDVLSDPGAAERWFGERGIDVDGISETDTRSTADVREALRALMFANNGETLDPHAAEVLNEAAANALLRVTVGVDGHGALKPAASGIDGALGYVLAAVFESMADGSWPSMKACRMDTCRWAFYDGSKNHSRTWCSMSVCGNRAKARSYRERHDS